MSATLTNQTAELEMGHRVTVPYNDTTSSAVNRWDSPSYSVSLIADVHSISLYES